MKDWMVNLGVAGNFLACEPQLLWALTRSTGRGAAAAAARPCSTAKAVRCKRNATFRQGFEIEVENRAGLTVDDLHI